MTSPARITAAAVRAKAAEPRSLQALRDAGGNFEIDDGCDSSLDWTLYVQYRPNITGHADTVAEAVAALWGAHDAEVTAREEAR